MAAAPKVAKGTTVAIGDGATSETFNDLEDILDGPSLSGFTTRIVEFVTQDGDTVNRKPAHRDSGQVTFAIAYDSADTYHAQLLTDHRARTIRNFQVTLTDTGAEVYDFAAVIDLSMSAPVEGLVRCDVTLHIDGDVTVS